ncbi:hypothetical protein C882_3401 [Caenispirillum salinarum AK4]|uniref:Uncharacterized protein n=1 Tax=Caenispirillum salinarum AK4 TaxID=1238182 RepID=K9HTV6_9PROT|nr:hypothetical protein [Caenispirillum salinarum]EKV31651.1 hypothetical protein C882_3401 [Caenispirillum salinarum AK4]
MKKQSVEVGQRFRERTAWGAEWEVEYVYQDGVRIPHARLRSLRSPVDARTLAIEALLDRDRFERVA